MDPTAAVVAIAVALIGALGLIVPSWMTTRKTNRKVDALAATTHEVAAVVGPRNGKDVQEHLTNIQKALGDIAGAQAHLMVGQKKLEERIVKVEACPYLRAQLHDPPIPPMT